MEAAAPVTAIWIVIAHFSVMGYGGDALPEALRDRRAFATEKNCLAAVPAVRRSFAHSSLPVQPDYVTCLKMEIAK